MGNDRQWGFTIIELILFLGITGALFAGLMIGVNSSISTQRYKESVVSLKTLVETQYAAVEYPRNERDDNWSCDKASGVVADSSSGTARGTSECVLLGRYLQVSNDGTSVKTGDVIGVSPPPANATPPVGDIGTLTAYAPFISQVAEKDDALAEGSRLVSADDTGVSSASFLILRSPLSGIIRTFATEGPLPASLLTMLNNISATAVVKRCVVSSGPISIPTQAITVNAAIGSANGVALEGNDPSC